MGTMTISSILTRGLAAGDWKSKVLALLINSAAFNYGYGKIDNMQQNNQAAPPQSTPNDGNIMPSMMSPISDQDLLNEIKLKKPDIGDFGPGKEGTLEFENAMKSYNEEYGDRIKTLESRIEPKKEVKEIKNLRSKKDMDMSSIGQEPDLPPLFLPMPGATGGEGDQQQGGIKGGAATGYPAIMPVDTTNSHVYISYKMFNISPALS